MNYRARQRVIDKARVRRDAKLYACIVEGGRACRAGTPRTACPYPDERRAKLWDQGWTYQWERSNA